MGIASVTMGYLDESMTKVSKHVSSCYITRLENENQLKLNLSESFLVHVHCLH